MSAISPVHIWFLATSFHRFRLSQSLLQNLSLKLLGFGSLPKSCKACRRPIKDFLLDQTKVCGLGNIYAAEALFRAAIHPTARADRLGIQRRTRLYKAILDTIADTKRSSQPVEVSDRQWRWNLF
ncbi:MAG: hypothetical protein C4325_04995 [Blastocatellia bacterium]